MNKKVLKFFIICLLSLFTTSCIPHDPLPNRDIVGKASSLDQLDEALKERMNFYGGKYDIENKDMVGNFLISNYHHPNIEDFTITATSSFTYNFEEPIKRCMFDDDEKFSNYYDIGYLESKYEVYFKDIGLEEEFFHVWITQKCSNLNPSVFIDENLIERKFYLRAENYSHDEVFNLYSNDLDIEKFKWVKRISCLEFTIEEYYTHYDKRRLIRTTSFRIDHLYPYSITIDDIVYDSLNSDYQVEDLLYLVSDEYSQNEKYVTFDLQFRAFLEEYIYVYEKFELRA